ncbi:MAG TPA: hypothetical protein VF796_24605, partial [Humisphaera sp.]
MRVRSRAASLLRHAVAVAGLAVALQPAARAATYYWDGNDATAGFGTAGGTWSLPTAGTTTSGWTLDSAGATIVNGGSVSTGTGDTLSFGSGTAGL